MPAARPLPPGRPIDATVGRGHGPAGAQEVGPPPAAIPRRPLLAPPPPIAVRPLHLAWPARAGEAEPAFVPGVRPPSPPPQPLPPFASLGLGPTPPEAALALAAAAWVIFVGLRRVVGRSQEGDDGAGSLASPIDLACRVAGVLAGGGEGSGVMSECSGVEEEEGEEKEEFDALGALDPDTLAAYRRFSRGAKLGRVREWA